MIIADLELEFPTITIDKLMGMSSGEVDALPFGVVGMSSEGVVECYNATESRLAGLPSSTVVGSSFFLTIAQCMNNYMVAQRFKEETDLDVTLPYVLTFRMRPTPVTLRLLKNQNAARSFVLIQR